MQAPQIWATNSYNSKRFTTPTISFCQVTPCEMVVCTLRIPSSRSFLEVDGDEADEVVSIANTPKVKGSAAVASLSKIRGIQLLQSYHPPVVLAGQVQQQKGEEADSLTMASLISLCQQFLQLVRLHRDNLLQDDERMDLRTTSITLRTKATSSPEMLCDTDTKSGSSLQLMRRRGMLESTKALRTSFRAPAPPRVSAEEVKSGQVRSGQVTTSEFFPGRTRHALANAVLHLLHELGDDFPDVGNVETIS